MPDKRILMKSLLILLFLTPFLEALKLGTPFRDNAILQRGMKVPVRGWSPPKVPVTFAGQTKQAVSGPDGKWMIELDPLKANATPAELTIAEKSGETITLKQ